MAKTIITKETIRTVSLGGLKIGGDKSVSFMSKNQDKTVPLLAIEIPYILEENLAPGLKAIYNKDFETRFKHAQNTNCDLLCVKFNIDEAGLNIEAIQNTLSIISQTATKPLIFKGTHSIELNKKLLPIIANTINIPSIIAYLEETSYDEVIESVRTNGHIAVMRSPIDINIAKELNILVIDKGQDENKILIDTDMGALGYGLDYGYSIMERIKLAGFEGDKMLNMPLIAFVGEEVFKTKEAKNDKFEPDWGDLEERAIMWEVSTATAVISAGANIVVVNHPKTIDVIKKQLENKWN